MLRLSQFREKRLFQSLCQFAHPTVADARVDVPGDQQIGVASRLRYGQRFVHPRQSFRYAPLRLDVREQSSEDAR